MDSQWGNSQWNSQLEFTVEIISMAHATEKADLETQEMEARRRAPYFALDRDSLAAENPIAIHTQTAGRGAGSVALQRL